jgi:hypothetical protein
MMRLGSGFIMVSLTYDGGLGNGVHNGLLLSRLENNRNRPQGEIDLHGLYVKEGTSLLQNSYLSLP